MTEKPYEITINLIDVTAILLLGLDDHYESLSTTITTEEEIEAYTTFQVQAAHLNQWKSFKKGITTEKQYQNGKHSGDCTNESHACLRCIFNYYQLYAISLADLFFKTDISFKQQQMQNYCKFIVFHFLRDLIDNRAPNVIDPSYIAKSFYYWQDTTDANDTFKQAYNVADSIGATISQSFIDVVE